jgi:hypothetical protein
MGHDRVKVVDWAKDDVILSNSSLLEHESDDSVRISKRG